jgi:hypothetical protein
LFLAERYNSSALADSAEKLPRIEIVLRLGGFRWKLQWSFLAVTLPNIMLNGAKHMMVNFDQCWQ